MVQLVFDSKLYGIFELNWLYGFILWYKFMLKFVFLIYNNKLMFIFWYFCVWGKWFRDI